MSGDLRKAIGKMVRQAKREATANVEDGLFYDYTGDSISKDQWEKLREDDDYALVGAFENEKVQILIEWVGAVSNADIKRLFKGQYPLFRLYQYDKNDNGDWIEAPEHGKTFPTALKAQAYYDEFVLNWTKSYRDHDGKIVEIENKLAKPDLAKPVGDYEESTW